MSDPTFAPAQVLVDVEYTAVAIPRPGLDLNEAKDKWLSHHPENKVLDDGGRGDPRLLVGQEAGKTVLYELIPELSPPEFTVKQALTHLRAAGFDVRGEGPKSVGGNPTVMIYERRK